MVAMVWLSGPERSQKRSAAARDETLGKGAAVADRLASGGSAGVARRLTA